MPVERLVAVESNATNAAPAETELRVLFPFAGAGGVALFTDSSIGKLVFASTRNGTALDVPPPAPGFVSDTETWPADAMADVGTDTISGHISPGLQFKRRVGVS